MAGFVKVGKTTDLSPGQGKSVEVSGKKIAIFNVDGSYYAIDDACTHRGGRLSEGAVEGNQVVCPWHGAAFDVTSGEALTPPAPNGVSHYKTRVEGNDVEVEV